MGSMYLSNLDMTQSNLGVALMAQGDQSLIPLIPLILGAGGSGLDLCQALDPPAVTWVLGVPPLSQIGRSPPSLTALGSANTITKGLVRMPTPIDCTG